MSDLDRATLSRREEIAGAMQLKLHRSTDRMFVWVLVAQWALAIILALVISPWSDAGEHRHLHVHVKVAIGFGALVNALPLVLVYARPGWWGTRHSIAVVQMLWSGMLIMITGGRIETHFHIFGSLAFLAFYRDWKLLATATVVVVTDHLARGLMWPDSVYGTANPEWWRLLEHAAWMTFENVVLVWMCFRGTRELRAAATREARLERMKTIVERKVVERTAQLEESSLRYRELVENAAVVPFELDSRTLEVLYVAPQASRLLGCSVQELDDRGFLSSAIHPDDRARVQFAISTFATSETSSDPVDYRLISKTGRNVFVRTLFSAHGRRIHGITVDITRQKQLELELRQAQRLESVGRLAAGVAHEINTPVQFVGDSVQFVRESMADLLDVVAKQQLVVDQVIARSPDNAEARAAVDAIAKVDLPYLMEEVPCALERAGEGLARVATIVRSMKVFAHPGGGHVSVDLNKTLESTLTIARHEFRYLADLDVVYGELPGVTCRVDEINQVFLNVLLNAAHAIGDVVKATKGRGTLTVRTRRDGGNVVVSIGDTGGGIPEQLRDRIFDPFFTTKQVGEGTGQGLAMASTVIARHDGSLTFDTAVGVGTTFHIRIPIERRPTSMKAA